MQQGQKTFDVANLRLTDEVLNCQLSPKIKIGRVATSTKLAASLGPAVGALCISKKRLTCPVVVSIGVLATAGVFSLVVLDSWRSEIGLLGANRWKQDAVAGRQAVLAIPNLPYGRKPQKVFYPCAYCDIHALGRSKLKCATAVFIHPLRATFDSDEYLIDNMCSIGLRQHV